MVRERPWSALEQPRNNPIAHYDEPTQRPQSARIGSLGAFPGAPIPHEGPEIVSYFQMKGDDLGRSVTQHKPLNKGPHAQSSLAKSFADTDHGQRPRVWAPAEVHKPCSRALTTSDIEGAQSRPKAAFATHTRNTNPVDPRYKLASCQPLSTDPILQTRKLEPSNSTQALRDKIQIHDIEGSSPAAYKQNQAQLHNSMDVKDIEGAAVGWKPPFRSHVGVRLRDPGLDVSDINGKITYGKLAPRRPDDPLVWTTGTLNNAAAQSVTHALGATAALKAKSRPASAGARLGGSAQNKTHNVEFTGLPVFQQARPQDGITSAPTFGDLHAREVQDQQRAVSALATMQQRNAARIDARVFMAQVERRRLNNVQAHQLRVQVADEQRAARKAGEAATAALGDCIMDSQKNVGALYHAWQVRDREACGKLTSAEFGQAMHALDVQVPPQVLTDLVRGLADTAGLVPYRELARAMVRRTQEKQRRDSARRRPASSQPKQQPQQHQPQQMPNPQHPHQTHSTPPPTSGAVVSAPEFLPQHTLSNKPSSAPEAPSKPAQTPSARSAPVNFNHPAPASISQPAHWSANNSTSTPAAAIPSVPVTQTGSSDVQGHSHALQRGGPSMEAPVRGESAGGMLHATIAQHHKDQHQHVVATVQQQRQPAQPAEDHRQHLAEAVQHQGHRNHHQHTTQATQQHHSTGGDAVAGQGPLQPGAGGVATTRDSAEETAAAAAGAAAATSLGQGNSMEGSASSASNHLKTAPDLQAVAARPKSAQGTAGTVVNHYGASNTLSPRNPAQAWGVNDANIEGPSASRPPSAFRQGRSKETALETARIEAVLQAGIPPTGVQILGPDGAKYFTFKGRTYWFAGNEPDSNFAQASKDYKPTREGPRPGGRNHMVSQPAVPYFDAPLVKGATLEPSLIGHKEVNNGLQAATPGGGSLGATLYNAGGHGAHTFMAASPTNTHARMRSASARGHKRPANPQHHSKKISSSITSVANAGAGPSMQRLEKATMRDELRAVRLLC